MNPIKNKWSQDLKFLNCHQKKSFVAQTSSNKKKVTSCCSVRYGNEKEWNLCMKKGCAFNISNKCSSNHIYQTKNTWTILHVCETLDTWRWGLYILEVLKIWKNKFYVKTFIFIYVKKFMYILVKLEKNSQNTLNILREKTKC